MTADPLGLPGPDYRLGTPEAAFEVKEFTSQDWVELDRAVRKAPLHKPSPRLRRVWACLVPAFNAVEELDREGRSRQPRVKRLAKDLVGSLEVLERYKVTDYRVGVGAVDVELRAACNRVGWLLRGGECSCMDFEGEPPFAPGVIVLGLEWGHSRSGDPDVFANLVQLWLDRRSANLRASLVREPGAHHGVVVVDESMVGEAQSATEMGLEFLPEVPLQLPEELDVLWVLIGSLWLRFDRRTGRWTNGSTPENRFPAT